MVVACGIDPNVKATEDGVLCLVVITTIGVLLPDVDVVGKCNALEDPAAITAPCPLLVISNKY